MVGKPQEEVKFRKLLREKLKVTKIPKLVFEGDDGTKTRFKDLYKFEKFLGTGSFGFVVAVEEISTGEKLALKIVDASQQSMINSLRNEAEVLGSLPPHQNVIQFKYFKEYTNYVLMAIEYARGGTI